MPEEPMRHRASTAFSPDWVRFESDGVPVYVHPDALTWFVPNQAGDRLLQATRTGDETFADAFDAQRFLERLPAPAPSDYAGRREALGEPVLRELWFHMTNRCDLACRHCLFASSPGEQAELSADTLLGFARQAGAMGCRVFALTGGEPFIHPEFERIVDGLLGINDAHVAILTNGMSVAKHRDRVGAWPTDRFHLQISVDGLQKNHDALRGQGAFRRLTENLAILRDQQRPYTLSMCVTRQNLADMPGIVDLAAANGAANVHYMWYFIRGRAEEDRYAPPEEIAPALKQAAQRAQQAGVGIDNLDALRGQVFAPEGTRHDGTNAGWESAAIGPDAHLYPTPATIGLDELAVPLDGSLQDAWASFATLERIRETTGANLADPLRFLLGGGDFDHSFMHGRAFTGADPYDPLNRQMALDLIADQARCQPDDGPPALRLKMGEILQSCGGHGAVALLHTNCLVGVATNHSQAVVRDFYTRAAMTEKTDILNPASYPPEDMAHIPPEFRFRGYGCGSPVRDADLGLGERVVDLGSGTGLECFIAAPQVGRLGEVVGIDMLDPMLERARRGADGVAEQLGYANLRFEKGYLEDLPLPDGCADAVISNCVLNLSSNKRKTFREILRVLRPGGRLVVSDVVCETPPDAALRNDEVLHGECVAGALTQTDLFRLLEETGFGSPRVVKRVPYREVRGHPFFSLTFAARRPAETTERRLLYRGPFRALVASDGTLLPAGEVRTVSLPEAHDIDDSVLILDERGQATNLEMSPSCGCACAPEDAADDPAGTSCCGTEPALVADETAPCASCSCDDATATEKLGKDCMVCGAELEYLTVPQNLTCHFCGHPGQTETRCANGHFVCDACHAEDAVNMIRHVCETTDETDMVALLRRLREHAAVPLHGPEHHALVPAIILATYRNRGGTLSEGALDRALQRAKQVAGGSCAFLGMCGAATGVGIAFALIREANPLSAESRNLAMKASQAAMAEMSKYCAARCCQRECWTALKSAAKLSTQFLDVALVADAPLTCEQIADNPECLGTDCPLFPTPKAAAGTACCCA